MMPAQNNPKFTPETKINSIYSHKLNRVIGGVQKRYLSTRTYHALKMFIDDPALFKKLTLLYLSESITDQELMKARNMGEKSLNEIRALLSIVNLSLKK